MKKFFTWIFVLYIVFVFVQSLFFKFTGSVETVIIFNTISDWMATHSALAFIAPLFKDYGGLAVGFVELWASLLLLFAPTRLYGALLALAVMSGAIFFHLGTPLGVDRVVDLEGNTDGGILFYMACGVWVSSLLVVVMESLGKPSNA